MSGLPPWAVAIFVIVYSIAIAWLVVAAVVAGS